MSRKMLLMLCNAVDGREDEFNDWYSDTHLPEIMQTEGFLTGQRFRLVRGTRMTADSPDAPYSYLTLYEVDEVERADAAIHRRARQERDEALAAGRPPPLQVSTALDRDMRTWWFESITELQTGTW